jgi:hypothetical protein
VAPSLYGLVASRIAAIGPEYLLIPFLANRCSREFVRICVELDGDLIDRGMGYLRGDGAILSAATAVRFHDWGILPENRRLEARDWIGRWAVEGPDADWMSDPEVLRLLSEEELAGIVSIVRAELIPNLDQTLGFWESNEQGDSAEEYYAPLKSALRAYAGAFREEPAAVAALNTALEQADRLCAEARYWQRDDDQDEEDLAPAITGEGSSRPGGRDVFDDVDQ